ncbi:Anthocyanidin 3-O-glucosyltransferase [Bertholletia excelsa]
MVSAEPTKPHVAVIPSPGMGHLIPLLEFAKLLVLHYGLEVTLLVIPTAASAAQNHLLSSLPASLRVVELPVIDISGEVVDENHVLTQLCIMVRESLRPLRSVLAGLRSLRALVIDPFCTQAFDVCEELSIPVYSFFTPSAALLAFSLYLPTMDREVEGEFVDLPGPVEVPGCRPIRTEDLLDQVKNRKIDEYKWFLYHVSRLPKAAGIFTNTWDALEPTTLRALTQNSFFRAIPTPPVHPIGPLIKQEEPLTDSDRTLLAWLDNQPPESVLFIALGSGGTLSTQQLTELALGLELSQQRFVLVARRPADASAFAAFFTAGTRDDDPTSYLPKGFVERTAGVGMVVPSWAPQGAVLQHMATGAFLSHCGWNSTLESLANGVPIVAWPLYAEQRMNAAALAAEEIGVAVKPAVEEGKEVVGKEEIERVVRLVMVGEEGKKMRKRAKELKESAKKALAFGGSSFKELSSLVVGWKMPTSGKEN